MIATTGHMNGFTPSSTGAATGKLALAFEKSYLEGDTRWKQFIPRPGNASTWRTSNL